MIARICVSTGAAALAPSPRTDLRKEAARIDVRCGITGMPAYEGERFRQFLEGPKKGL